MESKAVKLGLVVKLLMLFVALNIIGDIGNIAFWYASPDSQSSLKGGLIAASAGNDAALLAGAIVLAIVAVVYIVGLYGLAKKMLWAPLLIIAISVANWVLALLLYEISFAFVFWLVWTIILVAVSALVWGRMKA